MEKTNNYCCPVYRTFIRTGNLGWHILSLEETSIKHFWILYSNKTKLILLRLLWAISLLFNAISNKYLNSLFFFIPSSFNSFFHLSILNKIEWHYIYNIYYRWTLIYWPFHQLHLFSWFTNRQTCWSLDKPRSCWNCTETWLIDSFLCIFYKNINCLFPFHSEGYFFGWESWESLFHTDDVHIHVFSCSMFQPLFSSVETANGSKERIKFGAIWWWALRVECLHAFIVGMRTFTEWIKTLKK